MGSATRQAQAASVAALAASKRPDLALAEELFQAARVIAGSAQLRGVLATAGEKDRASAVEAVFSTALSRPAVELITVAAQQRWSTQDDLLAGIEELGLRAAADSAPADVDVERELFAFGSAVDSSDELELAFGNSRIGPEAKAELVESLLAGKVSAQTLAIAKYLVQQPSRRIRRLIRQAADIVADQAGKSLATVTAARPLAAEQLERLRAGLSRAFGRELRINQVVDPELVGGVRIRVGDDVIDGSIASRLSELRLRLAG